MSSICIMCDQHVTDFKDWPVVFDENYKLKDYLYIDKEINHVVDYHKIKKEVVVDRLMLAVWFRHEPKKETS